MSQITVIANHKGGVAKTTTAANLGAAYSAMGKRVLLIDLDPQCNLSKHFNKMNSTQENIYKSMENRTPLQPINIKDNLDIVISSLDLAALELQLISALAREKVLHSVLTPIRDNYDKIIVDCGPTIGILLMNAITVGTDMLIPVEPEPFALDGLSTFEKHFNMMSAALNPKLTIAGILITKYDSRKALHKDVVKAIRERYNDKVISTEIRTNVALTEAQAMGVDVFDYSHKSNGAIDYRNVATELLN